MELTREQIETMEAGPEMDGLVSVHIFGNDLSPLAIAPYSTHIAAAWRVEERMQQIDRNIDYARQLAMVIGSTFAEKGKPWTGTHIDLWWLIHATPLERCRAALLTVLAERGKEADGAR